MMHPFQQRELSDILLERQFASANDIESIISQHNVNPGQGLLDSGLITEEQLYQALAEQYKLPYINLDGYTVPQLLYTFLPAAKAHQLKALPYKLSDDTLQVVVCDPLDLDISIQLQKITKKQIELLLSTKSSVEAVLKESESTNSVLRDVSEDFKPVIVKETNEGKERILSFEEADVESAPVVKLINTILLASLQKRASDIHIENNDQSIVIKYRIDGVLYPATEPLDKGLHAALISRLKVMSDLDIAEKRIPQDGRFKLRLKDRDIDFRVSILPSIFGEVAVIRILDQTSVTEGFEQLSLASLNLAPTVLKKFQRAIREPHGMVLITGPTGSGKTTTLYAALTELNDGEEKMITIEDPVEYQLPGVVQIPVNEKKKLTFARGLRSILRHDPDKIMVGEIRDSETAQIAVQSALTGHLVFTTIHANNAFDVISRFSHMDVDVHSFVSALNCVMSQRLLRKICVHCKTQIEMDSAQLELSGLNQDEYPDAKWYEGKGCPHCSNTGYHGRSIISEFLDVTPKIRDMVTERRSISDLRATAVNEGMTTLRKSALALVIEGTTSLKEANRVTFVD